MKYTKLTSLIFLVFTGLCKLGAQNTNKVFYAGAGNATQFFDVKQLSNNNILIAGTTNSLVWLPSGTPLTNINLPDTVKNGLGTSLIPFLLYCSSDLNTILHVVRLNNNDAEDIRFIKFTNILGTATGSIYISGNTSDTKVNEGGYFIGKLNNNFVNGIPTDFIWASPVFAATGSYIKNYHPWDVNKDGFVYYGTGESHAANWAAMYSLDAITGKRRVVTNWLTHWYNSGIGETEYKYGKATTYTGTEPLKYSGIPLKHGRCDLRSRVTADYNTIITDENGFPKLGKMPFDFLFKSECDPVAPSTSGKGYNNNINGYSTAGSTSNVMGLSSITCDKRNNRMYIGLNSKSVLPNGNPDFEPAVIGFDNDEIVWWNRLYKESNDGINPNTSSPDQYVDAIAIDYSKADNAAEAEIVVAARQHGNNTISFWSARTTSAGVTSSAITANPTAKGFKDRFMGNSGNIHVGWLGRLKAQTGKLHDVTYVAELAEGATNYGAASTDPHLNGWPDPNAGNANLNTTYIQKNQLQLTGDGHVVIIAQGRRTLTTANAYQKMPVPSSTEKGSWNYFIREYRNDLSYAKYSSIITGEWDKLSTGTGAGGDNTILFGVCKTANGIIAVGSHSGIGNNVPVANTVAWGTNNFNGLSALVVYVQNDSIKSVKDNGYTLSVLPIAINLLPVNCLNDRAVILWNVEEENDNEKYEVEFSKNGTSFIQKNITGNTGLKHYSFADINADRGYYRIKVTHINGKYSYSNIVYNACNNPNSNLKILPLPVKDIFSIQLKNIDVNNAELYIINTNGKQCHRQKLNNALTTLSTKQLGIAAGIYCIKVAVHQGIFTSKLIVY